MHNLLQLIVRFSNFLLLVGLEVVAFIFVIRGNKYQQMVADGAANAVTASIQLANDNVTSYFHLRSDNEQLLEHNAQLLQENNLLRAGITQNECDPSRPKHVNDTLTTRKRDVNETITDNTFYLPSDRDYAFIPARVIAFSNDRHHNYLTLNKGTRDGVTPDMGVIGKDGIVGVVQSVSTHFAVVAPVIHEGLFISSRIGKNDYMATLHWHMPDIRHAELEDVARHVDVKVGDSIVTSGMSAIFPAGMPVGVVSDVSIGEGDSYYDIDVELATDFRSLRAVHILKYNHRAELDSIQ
ncbi:MAG: rod shape-determining protein MreC [Paludibacteraceae bacterium]|nr:rod shape-determining protein MreC [Paludibacteraceae bacterium]